MPWKVLASKTVFKNRFVELKSDWCELPNGKKIDYFSVGLRDWALGIGFTPNNKIVLTKQYRHPAKKELVELPAGVIRRKETPERAIQREFLEETGFELKEAKKIGTWFVSSGKSGCKTTAFVGKAIRKTEKQSLDPEEKIVILLKSPSETLAMIRNGKICSAPYIAALLAAKERFPEKFR